MAVLDLSHPGILQTIGGYPLKPDDVLKALLQTPPPKKKSKLREHEKQSRSR